MVIIQYMKINDITKINNLLIRSYLYANHNITPIPPNTIG